MVPAVLIAAFLAGPPADAANPSQVRKALASCLNEALRADLATKTTPTAFGSKLPRLCQAEKEAYRAASVAADVAGGITRAAAERNASMDMDDVLASTADRYRDYFETDTLPR